MRTTAHRPPSPAAAPDPPEGRILDAGHRRLTVGIVVAVLLIAFESMAVATAMPVAARELDGLALYAWGFSGFLTTSLVAMVISGEVSDTRGPFGPLLAGGLAFTAGLVVGGSAQSMPVFVLGRAVQGFGGGLIIVALYVVVARAYATPLRPRVFAAMSSAWVLPSIIGPALAGWIADALSWRYVFLAVAPLVLLVLLGVAPAVRTLPSRPPGGPAPATAGVGARRRRPGRKRLALAAAVGAALLQYAGQHLVVSSLLVGVAGAALLGASLPRLLPSGTLRAVRGLPTTIAMRGILAGAFFGAETFVPLMLIEERGLPTGLAGLSLTGGALGWALGSWYQGRPATRLPRPRLVQAGCALVAAGIGGISLVLLPAVPALAAAGAWAVAGLGMGLAMASVSVLMLEQSPRADQGANSAALQLSDALGSVALVGLAGAIFAGLGGAAREGVGTFAAIYAVMVGVALVGAWLAPRVRATAAT